MSAAYPTTPSGNPTLRYAIRADVAEMAKAKGTPYPSVGGLVDVLTLPGMWAAIVWRLAIAAHNVGLRPISRMLYFANIVLFSAELQPGVVVGPGVVIPHPVGVAFASGCTIGSRCRLMRLTGMGGSGNPKKPGHPTLGDDVWLLDAAKVLGPVTIGDRSLIGTNAVVSGDVPADMFVYGARRSDEMRPLAELGLSDHGGSLAVAEVTVAADRAERDNLAILPTPVGASDDGERGANEDVANGGGPQRLRRVGEG